MKNTDLEALATYYDTTDTSTDMADAHWELAVDDEPMITTSLRLPKSVLDRVRTLAAADGMKATALIRRWIEHHTAGVTDHGTQAILEVLNDLDTKVDGIAKAVKAAKPRSSRKPSTSARGVSKSAGKITKDTKRKGSRGRGAR